MVKMLFVHVSLASVKTRASKIQLFGFPGAFRTRNWGNTQFDTRDLTGMCYTGNCSHDQIRSRITDISLKLYPQ